MDDLLKRLHDGQHGATIDGLFMGSSIHADDVRTLATNKDTISTQADVVAGFAQDHGLRINPNKTEVFAFAKNARDFREDSIHICG